MGLEKSGVTNDQQEREWDQDLITSIAAMTPLKLKAEMARLRTVQTKAKSEYMEILQETQHEIMLLQRRVLELEKSTPSEPL